MTVKQLMAKLAEMPQDAEVCLETLDRMGGSDIEEIDEVFESVDNYVVIQSLVI
jgi:hypothetical protein